MRDAGDPVCDMADGTSHSTDHALDAVSQSHDNVLADIKEPRTRTLERSYDR